MKDLKELTSLIELVSANDGSSYYAQLEAGDFVLVLGRMPYSTNTFCKVLSNFGSKQGDVISVKPSDIRCKVTLDDVLTEILPTEKKKEPSIPTLLTGEFALTEVGSLVLVKEPATPDTYRCIVVAPNKDSSHYVGEVIRCHQHRISKVLPDKVAELITETMSVRENEKFKKGDVVTLKDDCNTLYRLGSEKNADTFYCMQYKVEKIEGVNSVKISPCEININLIKGLAPSKLVEQVKTVLNNLIKLL